MLLWAPLASGHMRKVDGQQKLTTNPSTTRLTSEPETMDGIRGATLIGD
jgi:hypothetical protein